MHLSKKYNFIFYFLFFILISFNSIGIGAYTNKEITKDDNLEEYINNNSTSQYILGPGDKLSISIFKPDFNNINQKNLPIIEQTIDGNGNIYIPILNKIFVEGLTTKELTKIINKKLMETIKEPDVLIEITGYKPITFIVQGEVETPGVHFLDGYLLNSLDQKSKLNLFPTLFDALRSAGGITNYADITSIEVIRKNSITNGGGKIKAKINFLDVFENGNKKNNIRILDGDFIKVKRIPLNAESRQTAALRSNLNKKYIRVFIGGRVESSGEITLPKSSTLVESLNVSGGPKIVKGPIKFVRFNSDGTLDKRSFKYRRNAKPGSKNNPYLRDGDIILVSKSKLNNFTEILSELTSPITPLVSAYGLYKAIND